MERGRLFQRLDATTSNTPLDFKCERGTDKRPWSDDGRSREQGSITLVCLHVQTSAPSLTICFYTFQAARSSFVSIKRCIVGQQHCIKKKHLNTGVHICDLETWFYWDFDIGKVKEPQVLFCWPFTIPVPHSLWDYSSIQIVSPPTWPSTRQATRRDMRRKRASQPSCTATSR